MPEFSGGTPEEFYAQHKELAAKAEAAKAEIEAAKQKKAEAEAEYQEAKAAGFGSYQDDLEARPTGHNVQIERAEQGADAAQQQINAQAELAKGHYQANEAAYREQAKED